LLFLEIGNFCGECPIHETGRQVTVHFARARIVRLFVKYSPGFAGLMAVKAAWVFKIVKQETPGIVYRIKCLLYVTVRGERPAIRINRTETKPTDGVSQGERAVSEEEAPRTLLRRLLYGKQSENQNQAESVRSSGT